MSSISIRKREFDAEIEKQIIINSITNTNFLKSIEPALKPNHFQIPYAKTVYRWVLEYYEKYKECPNTYIEDIYIVKKENLEKNESELISAFLQDVSDYYVDQKKEIKNIDYYTDKAIEYAKGRELLLMAEEIAAKVKTGDINNAESLISQHRQIAKVTSDWVNPNDLEYAKSVFQSEDTDVLIKFPGALGDLMGPLERGWFISSIGPAKIGKSFFLHEIRTLGLFEGLKVVEINLEMKSKQLAKRYYQRISAFAKEEGSYLYPVFDCRRNQEGTCTKALRTNNVTLVDSDGFKCEFGKHHKDYQVCTLCRGTDDFELTTWFEEMDVRGLSYSNIIGKIKAQKMMYGDNFRLKTYARFSATLDDVNRDLDLLAYTENFVPDLIVYDYADATRTKVAGRDGINNIWMNLARMAGERNALLATTTHANVRRTEGKRSVSSSDAQDDTRKLNHVDMMISHSVSKEERRLGIIRCAVVEHRHKFFDELDEVMVTRSLNTGQSLLDSERIKRGFE